MGHQASDICSFAFGQHRYADHIYAMLGSMRIAVSTIVCSEQSMQVRVCSLSCSFDVPMRGPSTEWWLCGRVAGVAKAYGHCHRETCRSADL